MNDPGASSPPLMAQPIAPATASPRIRRIQRAALILLVVGGVINYVDRATLAIGLPLIRSDLHFSMAESGFLLSAFLWAYAFAQLPAGALVDRIGARGMLSGGLGLWSLAQVLGGFVGNFWQFIVVRVLLGVGESPQFPTCARVVSDWFHRRERGFATGVWNCSSSLGTAIAAPLLTFLMLQLGWRWMFATMGLVGLAIAAVAFWLHRNPDQVDLTSEERAYLADDQTETKPVTWQDWKDLCRFPTTWGMILGFFGTVYVLWIYNAWLPQYLATEWHLSIARTGWVAAIPYVFGVGGSLIGGHVCDALVRRGFSPLMSRKWPIVVTLLGTALFTVLAAYAPTSTIAVCCISISLFLLNCNSSAAWAMASVAATKSCTASIGSIQNFGGYLGGASAPIVTGLIVQATGSFKAALVVGGLVGTTAAIAHFILVQKPVVPGEGRVRSEA